MILEEILSNFDLLGTVIGIAVALLIFYKYEKKAMERDIEERFYSDISELYQLTREVIEKQTTRSGRGFMDKMQNIIIKYNYEKLTKERFKEDFKNIIISSDIFNKPDVSEETKQQYLQNTINSVAKILRNRIDKNTASAKNDTE